MLQREKNILSYFEMLEKPATDVALIVTGDGEAIGCWRRRQKRGLHLYLGSADFNPINNHQLCYIHFSFPDGSHRKSLTTIRYIIGEIRELMSEKDFQKFSVQIWRI